MFKSYSLKFTKGASPLTLAGEGVTIFVGANNSGKSLLLREIEAVMTGNLQLGKTLIFEDYSFTALSWNEVQEMQKSFEPLQMASMPDTQMRVGRFLSNGQLEATVINKEDLKNSVASQNKAWMARHFLRYFLIRLDGRTRFALTDDREMGDLAGSSNNELTHLFKEDDRRKIVRDLIFDSFGRHYVIDPTRGGGMLRIRLSDDEPGTDEQSLSKAAREFHGKATYIKEASDGVQAYVGILTAVLSGEYRAILIDEPEAFLHPPLARKLGQQLSTIAKQRGGCLLASTHSPDFLIGCIQGSPTIRVVRLEYLNGKSRGKLVDTAEVMKLFQTPLLRSANVISALFHDGVVITESDNDRAFYAEIYYRLSQTEKGYPSLLFLNGQNKQTIKTMLGPLRQFGIPAAAIADIDVIKEGGNVWTGWLKATQVPELEHTARHDHRDKLKKCFDNAGKDMKKDGVEALPEKDREGGNNLFDFLDDYGFFVVRRGELERWLPSLGATGEKTQWTISALEKMGSDPNDSGYLKPAAGDVWDFMRKIVAWVKDTGRKGTD